jgi:hypothetical protein
MYIQANGWIWQLIIDTGCLLLDSGATIIPGVPGGLGAVRTATRTGKIITKARKAISLAQPLEPYMKDALRAQGRRILIKVSPMFSKVAAKMGKALEVHHIIPLEWVHLMGKDFNPNMIDNLVGVKNTVHYKISEEWLYFKQRWGNKVTREKVLDFAAYISEKYRTYFVH